ncbi:MAG: 50S ribosomal protein L30 [Calditrichaceae bacterium]|nr:50S ribosomal protein L30 [Calditrichaceae bacterium]MBN2709083.1 50S ribosomal protein L30 [Calditrichaceae bacterium]RQV97040.1 MAG: 50S ribosomal protein L30 [Calditrichota bacterium]
MAEKNIKITQIKSAIGFSIDQKRTMAALGIRKINHSRMHKATPQILGMINKVKHLVKVEEI